MTKPKPKKITPFGKVFKELHKNDKDKDKYKEFCRLFLKSKFWMMLDESERKNLKKYGKNGIKNGTILGIALLADGSTLLCEDWKDIKITAAKRLEKGKMGKAAFIQQTGQEIIQRMRGRSTSYSIKSIESRDMFIMFPKDVAWIKNNLIKK
jgi:hypothetical protein